MRLLILGASGGVGKWLTRLAAQRGHDVRVIVRSETSFEPPGEVEVLRGDATDARVLDEAVEGADAVLSALGLRRAGKSPSARLLSPVDLTQRVVAELVQAMQRHSVNRVMAVSAGGVGDSFEQLSWPVQRLVSSGNIAVSYRDLEAMERVLAASDLDWLAVRPVTLVDGEPTGRARPVASYGLLARIRRADVAEWMLNTLESHPHFRERMVLLGS